MTTNNIETLPITHPKKLAFLEQYPKFTEVRVTCSAVDIGKTTFYRWLEEDKQFKDAWAELKKQISADLIELHEKNIDNVAFDPKTPAQSRIFGSLVRLRAEAPEKYREKQQETRFMGDITIKMAIPPYDEGLRLMPVPSEVKQIEAKPGEEIT